MNTVNTEMKKIVDQLKTAQNRFQELLKSQDWVEDARKFAERQSKEVKKLITADVDKMKTFLEKERKELEKLQKQIPGEVKKLRQFAKAQRKELEKLLTRVTRAKGAKPRKKTGAKRKTAGRKKAPATTPAGV